MKNLISFRQMAEGDVETVLSIIEEHDEDDAEEAEKTYAEEGTAGQYVVLLDGEVIGVSGANELDDCDRSFQLSWTYLDIKHCNKGYGRQLLTHILDELKKYNARKVFIYVSDYQDEKGVNIYQAAMHLYQSLGFELELAIKDYYDQGESLSVLSLQIEDKDFDTLPIKPESPKIKFNNLIHIAETETAYSFGWQIKRFGKNFSASDIELGLQAAKDNGATLVLISFPSNFDNVQEKLFQVGFSEIGQLKDYYEEGVHEVHYAFDYQNSTVKQLESY